MSVEVSTTPDQAPCTIVVRGFLRYVAVVPRRHRSETTLHDTGDFEQAIMDHLDGKGIPGRGHRLDDPKDQTADYYVVPGVIPGTMPHEVVVGADAVAFWWDADRFDIDEVHDEVMRTLRRLRDEGLLPVTTDDFVAEHMDLGDSCLDQSFDSIHRLWCAGQVVLEKRREDDFDHWISLPDDED